MAHILIAEDDTPTRRMLEETLEKFEHGIHTVMNGREALEHITTQHTDVLVLDLMMPGIDGAGVIRAVRADATLDHLKIIVLTGNAQPEIIPETRQADMILHKPIAIEKLVGHIRSFI